jgi:hypothetical protein
MDSISLISEADEGAVIICGSHGGAISGAFASLHRPSLVIFNDAGGGKADAGRAAIAMLDELEVPCATVSHTTARIGDAEDAWLHGTLSAAGIAAKAIGIEAGQSVRDAVQRLASAQA